MITLNGRFLEHPRSGTGIYAREVLPRLREVLAVHGMESVIYGPRPAHEVELTTSGREGYRQLTVPGASLIPDNIEKVIWEQVALPVEALRQRSELIFAPYFGLARWGVPSVATIHDLIPLAMPEYIPHRRGEAYLRLLMAAARRSPAVITDSVHSADDIMRRLGLPSDRIHVVPLGVGDEYRQPISPRSTTALRGVLGLPDEFILYLGGADPRKNLDVLLRASDLLRRQSRAVLPLVIVAPPHRVFKDLRILAAELDLSGAVQFLEWVHERDKPTLYAAATAFVYPSRYEGFGLPPLEAMACGTPVICTACTSLPEVTGDAALVVGPDDVAGWADALERISEDGGLRRDLEARGRVRSRAFTWDKTTAGVVEVVEAALRAPTLPSPIHEVPQESVPARAAGGVVVLLARQFALQLIGFVATIFLARLLSPADFGLYAISVFVLLIFSFVGDFGFGGAMLQKRGQLEELDLRTAFTVQQVLLTSIMVVFFLLARPLAQTYHLGDSGAWYLRATAVAGVFTSLKTIPNIVLQRQLRFGRLTVVDIVENVLFRSFAVGLAIAGFRVWSLIVAIVVSRALGAVAMLAISGWRPAVGFSLPRLKAMWSFGIAYQLGGLALLLREYLIPIVGGLVVGAVSVGYLNWALLLAAAPGQLAVNVGRVAFPAFARYQADPPRLAQAVVRTFRALVIVAVPAHLFLVVTAPILIHVVFTDKWLPALLAFYFLSIDWTLSVLTQPLLAVVNATGRARLSLVIGVGWTAATLASAIILVPRFGFAGIAIAYAVTRVLVNVVLYAAVRSMVQLRLLRATWWPMVSCAAASTVCLLASRVVRHNLVGLVALMVVFGVCYLGLLFLRESARLRQEYGPLVNQAGGRLASIRA